MIGTPRKSHDFGEVCFGAFIEARFASTDENALVSECIIQNAEGASFQRWRFAL